MYLDSKLSLIDMKRDSFKFHSSPPVVTLLNMKVLLINCPINCLVSLLIASVIGDTEEVEFLVEKVREFKGLS